MDILTAGKPKIEVRQLNLFFGTKQVLKQNEITIPEHTIVALIGPSGSGKSTLLRSMNRMHDLSPTAKITGDILLDGAPLLGAKIDPVTVRQRVGMVFQRPNPFPKSIFDNVAYGLRIKGIHSEALLQERVEKALRQSALWDEVSDDLQRSALSLSGGQQQRLCIARAIAVEPEVLLLDEPCSALDPISTAKIEALMIELKPEFTQIIVTHNMQEAQRVADFTAFMYLGEIIEYGPTREIFENPKHELTQNYVGGHFG